MSFNAGAIVSKLTLDKKSWDKSVQDVKSGQKTLGGYVQQNSAKFRKMGMAMTVAGGAIVATFGLMIKKYVAAGDQIDKMSRRTGFAAETLSELRYAAEISGANIESLEKGIKRMAKTIVDAGDGMATYIRSFDRIGVSVEELKTLNPEEQFLKIAAAIAEVEDPTIRAATAQDIFGRAGTQLLPLFAQGADGLDALREKAHELGIVFDTEAAEKAARLADAQLTLTSAMRGVTISIAENLAPALSKLAEDFADVVAKVGSWIKEHPKLTSLIAKGVLILGSLMTVLGPIVMLLPGIVTALPAIAIGIHALLGPLGAVTAAAIAAYKIISKLTKAKSDMVDADYAAAEATHKFGQKLRKISDEAGLSRREFIELTKKYKGNTLALAMAIKRGKEGVKLQKAMVKIGKENVKEYDKQKKGLKKLDEDGFKPLTVTIPEVMEETKTWVDYMADMGLKTVEEKADRVEELEGYIDDLSKAYKDGKIDLQDYTRAINKAKGEIKNLSTSISTTALPAFRDMSGVFDSAVGEMEDRFPDITKTVDIESDKIAGRKDSIWNTMADGLQTKWASTMGELIRGTTSLKDGLKGIWDTVLTQFTDMIGAMVAKWITGFIGNTLSSLVNKFVPGVKSAMGSTSEAAAGASTSIGASMAAAFNVAVVVAWAAAAWSVISGWGDKVNEFWKEQRTEIDKYIGRLKEMGRTWREIKDIMEGHWWAEPRPRPPIEPEEPGGPGKGGGGGGKWAEGFEGIVTEPIRPLIGEAGPEWVSVQPLSGGRSPSSSNVTVNNYINLNGTIITDRDYTRKRLIPEMLSALEANFEKTKMKQILGIA